MTKPSIVDWHRLFGMIVERDFFDYGPLRTEREKDLSIKEQLLDVLVVYTESVESIKSFLANPPKPLPDGLENLSQHNLITYKSFRESLNEWTLQELTGHYVNHRKNTAVKDEKGSYSKLLPEDHFRLYAVCTRFPRNLMRKYKAKKRKEGVYDIVYGGLPMRVIVLRDIPQAEQNAIWNIFSNVVENIEYGALQYGPRLKTMSSVLDLLFEYYNLEGMHVAYTFEQFERDHFLRKVPKMLQDEDIQPSFLDSIFKNLSPAKFMARFSPKERLEGLSPDERLEGLSPDEIKVYLRQIESKN